MAQFPEYTEKVTKNSISETVVWLDSDNQSNSFRSVNEKNSTNEIPSKRLLKVVAFSYLYGKYIYYTICTYNKIKRKIPLDTYNMINIDAFAS